MNSVEAIREAIRQAEFIALGYLSDLKDEEMFHRPAAGANHITWQLGHLITSEHKFMEHIRPGSMPPLPEGFADRYAKAQAACDDPAAFDSRADLLRIERGQRAGTLALLESLSDADLEQSTGIDYAPTVGALLVMQSVHWVMHAGQWAVVRRQLGRPPLY